jgi:hypothetical protein
MPLGLIATILTPFPVVAGDVPATCQCEGWGSSNAPAQPRIALWVVKEPDTGRAILFQNLFPILEERVALDALLQKKQLRHNPLADEGL